MSSTLRSALNPYVDQNQHVLLLGALSERQGAAPAVGLINPGDHLLPPHNAHHLETQHW
jgi:hypothetical protein